MVDMDPYLKYIRLYNDKKYVEGREFLINRLKIAHDPKLERDLEILDRKIAHLSSE